MSTPKIKNNFLKSYKSLEIFKCKESLERNSYSAGLKSKKKENYLLFSNSNLIKNLNQFIQDLLSSNEIKFSDDQIKYEIVHCLSISNKKYEDFFSEIDRNDMNKLISILTNNNYHKTLSLFFEKLQSNYTSFKEIFSTENYNSSPFKIALENKYDEILNVFISYKNYSEQFLAEALYDSVDTLNPYALEKILTCPLLNPNIINPNTGMNALHLAAYLICKYEAYGNLLEQDICKKCFDMLLNSSKIDIFTPIGNANGD